LNEETFINPCRLEDNMAIAQMIGRRDKNNEDVWVVGTPHFLESWSAERYGKSKSATLTDQLGSWKHPHREGFYESMLDAPIDATFYAVIRKRAGLKPIAFIYFRNIKNEVRGGRRELELISVTPPNHGKTEGINYETFQDHAETEEWVHLHWRY
jgi:hypothetical protein|tara:strand:- start:1782 stop:2246 length:465 start_codon:yes stop_codon:yes gene_type:complete